MVGEKGRLKLRVHVRRPVLFDSRQGGKNGRGRQQIGFGRPGAGLAESSKRARTPLAENQPSGLTRQEFAKQYRCAEAIVFCPSPD